MFLTHTIETYGRHAWPILLFALHAVVIPLLIWDGLVKNPDKTRTFLKNRPDTRTEAEKEDVSGETLTYGNPSYIVLGPS